MNKNSCRDSKIEALRIGSMIAIICYHIIYYGVIHNPKSSSIYEQGSLFNKVISLLATPGGQVGVGIFFILTGYFMKKVSIEDFVYSGYKKIVKIINQVFFYAVLQLLLLVCLICFDNFENYESLPLLLRSIITTIFIPTSSGLWWFATAYLELIIIAPFLNHLLKKFNHKQLQLLIIVVWFFGFTIGSLGSHLFILYKAIFFYLIGFYIRNFNVIKECRLNDKISLKAKLLFCVVITWLIYSMLELSILRLGDKSTTHNLVVENLFQLVQRVILVPICSMTIVLLVLQFNSFHSNVVNKISSYIFGVYLLHDAFLIRMSIWNQIFKVPEFYQKPFFLVYLVILIMVILLLGLGIDFLRVTYCEKYLLNFEYKIFQIIKNIE